MSCFDRRDEFELLGLAMLCQRFVDIAIKAAQEKRSDWFPADADFKWNKRGPSYAKTYLVGQFFDNPAPEQVEKELRAMSPRQAIDVLRRMEKRALWQMHRPVPRPDLSRLLGVTPTKEEA